MKNKSVIIYCNLKPKTENVWAPEHKTSKTYPSLRISYLPRWAVQVISFLSGTVVVLPPHYPLEIEDLMECLEIPLVKLAVDLGIPSLILAEDLGILLVREAAVVARVCLLVHNLERDAVGLVHMVEGEDPLRSKVVLQAHL